MSNTLSSGSDFFLMSYVHSGTFFCFGLLSILKYKPWFFRASRQANLSPSRFTHFHPGMVIRQTMDMSELKQKRIITPCRHPHHIFLSHYVRYIKNSNRNVAELLKKQNAQWNLYFEMLAMPVDYQTVLINCPPEKRETHLLNVCNYVNPDLVGYESNVSEYAQAWEKKNQHRDQYPNLGQNEENLSYIDEYDNDPQYFIKKFNLDKYENINRALEWYNIEMSKV